jgi:hypothetical protein
MKYSTFFLLFVFCLLAFAQAAPVKGKPKPKPKPKKHKHVPTDTMYPTFPPSKAYDGEYNSDSNSLQSSDHTESAAATTVESTGLVAVLGGVAVACVVAIVAIVRKSEIQHEPLPASSERAVDSLL